jgi:CRP/FNR family transcriptional regulator
MPVDRPPLARLLDLVEPAGRDDLLAAAETLTLPKGSVLFRTGEAGNGLYELVEGKVKLSRLPGDTPDHPANRHELLLRLLSPGQIFGELATFDGGPRNATAIALTEVVARRYPPEALEPLLRRHPDLAVALLAHVSYRLRFTLERTIDLQIHDSGVRLAKAILILALRFGDGGVDEIVVRHDLTQAELGGLTGPSRETVSKVLADFAARGPVDDASGQIVIKDAQSLRKIAGTYS